MIKLYLTSSFIFFTVLGVAQNYTALNGPYSGTPSKIISTGSSLIGTVYGNGLLKSTDNGITWTATNTGLTNLYLNDITRDAVSGKLYALAYSQVFTSTDNGANWSLTANSGFTNGRFIRKATSFLYIIGGNNVIYRSSNDGVTWSQVNSFTGYPTDFELSSSGFLYISTDGGGIIRSTNNGLSVDVLDSGEGITDLNIRSLVISGTTLFAASYTGPLKSTNNGDTWTSIRGTIPDSWFYNTLIEKDPSGNIYLFNDTKVYKTVNSGTSWTTFDSPIPANLSGGLISPYFESSTVFYMGVDRLTLFKTIDSGASWIPLFSSGLTASNVTDFVLTDNGRLLYSNDSPYGIFMSIDDGATWDFLSTGATGRQIDGFLKSGSTIYGYGSGIIKTTNNGSSWSEQTSSNYFNNLVAENSTKFYSVTQVWDGTNNIWALNKSNDAGITWISSNITGLPNPNCSYVLWPQVQEVFYGTSSIFIRLYEYCSNNKNVVFKINPTTGAATELTSVPSSNQINSIDFKNGRLYVFTSDSKLHISNDDGQTWTTKSTTSGGGRIQAIDNNNLYILNSSVFLSNDGGTSWVNTGSPDGANKQNKRILLSGANYSYVAQDYGKVYKSNAPVVPPVAPTGLASIGFDRNSVGLIWNDNSNNEDRFVIEASEGNNLNYDSVGQATRPGSWARSQGVALISSIKGAVLKSNTTYFFRVRASASGGKSAPSNEISVTTAENCAATSVFPQNRSWTATTLNTSGVGVLTALNQTLTGSTGFYQIQNLPLGAGVGLSPTPANPWVVAFEENCGGVFISSPFSQYIANGNGTWNPTTNTLTIPWQTHPQYPMRTETTVYTLNATDPAPAAPTDLAATVFTPGHILLNWTSGNFTSQFEVERSTTSGSGFTKIADVIFPLIAYKDLDPGLVTGTTYYYRVRAKNASGTSAYSAEVNIIPRSNYLFLPMSNLPGKTFTRTGGGGAWGDIDGDGINDLALPVTTDSTGQNVAPPLIFRSLGNGQFVKYPIPELADMAASTRNINIIDINNDGLNDIFISVSNASDILLIRKSDGTYQKITMTQYTQGGIPNSSWADYDNDGYLDLLVTTWTGLGTASDKVLLHNNSGDGTFTRITEGELVTDFGYTRETQWADYDNDGDQDVIVLNQASSIAVQQQTRLYKNNGDGTFTRVLGSVFESFVGADRSCSWGDYDNDGHLDIFIAGTSTNRLYRNLGDGTFLQVTGSVVEETTAVTGGSFGSGWGDIDNDGDLDLFAMGFNTILYYNNGNGTFTKYITQELFNAPGLSKLYGPALEDVDNDGFLDFHNGGFSNPDIANFIYKNTTPASASKKYIKINLKGSITNRSAIGARITLVAGGKTQIREVQSHTAQSTQSSPTQHFGLGSASVITSIVVNWPSGLTKTLNNVAVNQTITIVEDDTPPAITFTAPATLDKGFSSTTFSATVTDEGGVVSTVSLHHRKISGSTFTIVNGTYNSATSKYDFVIPESLFDASGLEYYFTATDPINNVGRLPVTDNFFTRLVYKTDGNLVPSERMGFGGTAAGWRIFTIPFELGSNNAVSTIFDELGGLEIKKEWRMVTLKDNTTWDEYPTAFSTLTRGKGYFINIKTPVSGGIKLPDATAPSNHRGNLFQINLKEGWNQIGNPYLSSINWSDVVTLNGLTGTAQQLKTFSGGSYGNGTSLLPFEGGFVLSAGAVTISIPFAGQTAAGGRIGENTSFEEGDWIVPISLKQGEIENTFGGIGMHHSASESYDQFDDINAPRFIDFVEMNFEHPEHFAKRFARDVVPVQEEYSWSFTIDGNVNSGSRLMWDNTSLNDQSQDLFLLDESRQVIINMREQGSYDFDLGKSKNYKIYYGNNLKEKIRPQGIVLGEVFPNPSSGLVTIPFTVSGNDLKYHVRMEIYDMTGRKITSLIDAELAPGYYSAAWDSTPVSANGLYTCRLTVTNGNQPETRARKIILSK